MHPPVPLSQRPAAPCLMAIALFVLALTLSGCGPTEQKTKADTKRPSPSAVLTLAIYTKDVAAVRALLDAGLNPNHHEASMLPPIFYAVQGGDTTITGLLIQHGADVNVRLGKDEATPLMRAAASLHPDVVSQLLKAGAHLDAQDRLGATALMWASVKGCQACATRLIAAGALLDVRGRMGETALQLAVETGDLNMVKLLLDAGADQTIATMVGTTPLQAAENRRLSEIAALLRARTKQP